MAKQKRSSAEIAKILEEYWASGKTQKAFAQARRLPLSTLTFWLRRARRVTEGSAASSPWVPVVAERETVTLPHFRVQLRNKRWVELPGDYPRSELGALLTCLENDAC